jgi:hypothetical protein
MPPELAALGWVTAIGTLSAVVKFLYSLYQQERRERQEAVASERATAARVDGVTAALEALTDVLGRA